MPSPVPTAPERPFREHTRAPLEAAVTLQFEAFAEPEAGFTANVSTGGMFVPSAKPPPVGTRLRFEVELEHGAPPVRGLGEVVWIRLQSKGPDQPRGMGIQFRYLDPESGRRLRAAVSYRWQVEALDEAHRTMASSERVQFGLAP